MPDLRQKAIIAAANEATAPWNRPQEERYPWHPDAWKTPQKLTPLRYPLLLTPGGLISSASDLQKLAETESLPEAIETSQVDLNDREFKKGDHLQRWPSRIK